MAEGKKSRKVGRSKRNGQAARYKNERRDLQNKLRRLKKYVAAALHRCQDAMGQVRSETPFGQAIKPIVYDYKPKEKAA